MNFIKRFIESNRQTGTTTALIRATRETRGYLIVADGNTKANILRRHEDLKDRIYTIYELQNKTWIGRKEGCVFFDTDAVYRLCSENGFVFDGYVAAIGLDAVAKLRDAVCCNTNCCDGYVGKVDKQLNVKLTTEDKKEIDSINKEFFEGEATDSMIGRVLLRKGIHYYNKLRNSLDKHSL